MTYEIQQQDGTTKSGGKSTKWNTVKKIRVNHKKLNSPKGTVAYKEYQEKVESVFYPTMQPTQVVYNGEVIRAMHRKTLLKAN